MTKYSNTTNLFYNQINIHRELPFDMKLSTEKPVDVSILTEEKFNAELEKGYADIRKDYNL